MPSLLTLSDMMGTGHDVVRERGEEAIERVRELTEHGAHSVLECVGSSRPL